MRNPFAEAQSGIVSIIAAPNDPVVASTSCLWALNRVKQGLRQHGVRIAEFESLPEAPQGSFCIVASDARADFAKMKLEDSRLTVPNVAESLALIPFIDRDKHGTLACGDDRGLMYALLELADRIEHSDRPLTVIEQPKAIAEAPFSAVRSVGRIFCSDVQDKPWFNDREMWPAYFDMLATQRFNRFSLNLGIGYDFLDEVSDAYFLFAYPFLVSVPGYTVRAINLPEAERERNLEMLRFISAQAVAHGIDFQLGIWTHGYHWGPSSQPNYTIEGVTPENHAVYSRDALTTLLKACPDISGITLRTHGESGVREGSYGFWKTIFSALPACGREVRLDLHTKGLNQELIDVAVKTGVPVTLSPKYWAEHMGLPYQQASIRELEMPHQGQNAGGLMALSGGSRSFTRYGYADFLRQDREYRVMFRVWPGSHRLLLWGDPASSAAHARAFAFCGADGAELFEPLSFKGRRGSGIAGNRCAYADASLNPRWDWQKYLYTYRSWGRLMYNPQAAPDTWQRYYRKQFGPAAAGLENALAAATPITQIITTAHLPSAANEGFSPEYYTNQPIVDASKSSTYSDTPAPKVFGNVSSLDPQLFLSIDEFVAELLGKEVSGKYSPLEVAQWLNVAADTTAFHLRAAQAQVKDQKSVEFRRAAVDLTIHAGIGCFFAAKLRSGVFYAAFEQTVDRATLTLALKEYRRARDIWKGLASEAKGVYVSDITFGPSPHQRGNWLDRLTAIEEDIAEMQARFESAHATSDKQVSIPLQRLTEPSKREPFPMQHKPAATFVPGQPLEILLEVPSAEAQSLRIRLHYRHVNQAERYDSVDMLAERTRFSVAIPADYSDSQYPLQYYFELRRGPDRAWLFPGLGDQLSCQPYYVVLPKHQALLSGQPHSSLGAKKATP